MTRRLLANLLLIFFLLITFPLLWLYNQRLNYQSFLTLKTKFSISANSLAPDELSSVNFVIGYLKDHGLPTTLVVKIKNPPEFGVLGRILRTSAGDLEVYEYSDPKDAAKRLAIFEKDSSLAANVHLYKNLLIYNPTKSAELQSLIKELNAEKMD